MQANGAAHWANNHNNTWHAKKVKRHTLMRGVAAAGLEEGAVVPSEVVEARLVTQIEAWVEACSKRALLASLLLGLMVRDSFTRVTVLADGQELLEEIPAEDADIPDFAERNLFLQLGRGMPPPGLHSQPSAAVEDVLTAYPDLHAELDEIPRYPHDCNTVDDVGQKLETSFANSLTELFKRRVGQAVALAGARVIAGSHEHQRRFGLPVDGSPAWTERQRSWVVRSVRGKEVTWLEGQGGVVPTVAMRVAGALRLKRQREPFDNEYILGLLWQQRGQLACAAVMLLLCTASNLGAPVLSGMLLEALVQQQPIQVYFKLLGMLTVGYVLEPFMTKIYMNAALRAAETVLATLRMELFRTLLMQKVSFFEQRGAAELTSLISVELDTIRSFIFSNVTRDRGLRALLEMVGSVCVLFALSWRLAPVCSIIIVATAVAATIYRRRTREVEQRQGRSLQQMTSVALQALENMRTVRYWRLGQEQEQHQEQQEEEQQEEEEQQQQEQGEQEEQGQEAQESFAGEALERERFQTHVAQSYKAGLEFASAKAWFEASNRGAIHASLLALYAWGGWLVSSGLMPLRVMVSGIGFTFSLMYATQASGRGRVALTNQPTIYLAGTVNTLSELRRASGAFSRVSRIPAAMTPCQPDPEHWLSKLNYIRQVLVSSEPDPSMYGALPPGAWWEVANGNAPPVQPYADKAGTAAVEAAQQGPLELRDVTFSYPVRPHVKVLEGLTLTLPRGSVTAVVGRSGAGKSTVAALLSRFYKPQEGAIYLAGRPALSFSRGEWSKAIAMVSQDPVLFTGTIAENIAYGKYGKATQEEVQAAAEAANAHEFIQQLPDGYATVVGERGALLSGGQRQRIAIARALLKDSPIIILDEATSALDSVSEAAVQQAVQRLVHGRTVLVIAHRLSTVQTADQIVVMADGRAVEVGTHLELSAKQGSRYNELMKAQELILASV
ncbi:hypothetical protein QJQ45_024133 [Haematococcus lacustris]|nr:hypothetical protein QJQ45_024133 [Haematococcus lacustris]